MPSISVNAAALRRQVASLHPLQFAGSLALGSKFSTPCLHTIPSRCLYL